MQKRLKALGLRRGVPEGIDLGFNKRFAHAANNLAWILADQGKDLDRAYELGGAAHDVVPNDPSVADTLGWINHKRGSYQAALPLLMVPRPVPAH